MAIGKRQATGAVVVSGRFINPAIGGRAGIHAEPSIIDAYWIFIDENPRHGSTQTVRYVTLFFEQFVGPIARRRRT